jgi:hypothetical protein
MDTTHREPGLLRYAHDVRVGLACGVLEQLHEPLGSVVGPQRERAIYQQDAALELPQLVQLQHPFNKVPQPVLVLVGLGRSLLDLPAIAFVPGDEELLLGEVLPDIAQQLSTVVWRDELDSGADRHHGEVAASVLADDRGLQGKRKACARDSEVDDASINRGNWSTSGSGLEGLERPEDS